MKSSIQLLVVFIVCSLSIKAVCEEAPLSAETEECIGCHAELHSGLVSSWLMSRHSQTKPAQALEKPELQKRISADILPDNLLNVAVGCYECHSLRTDQHGDSFEHNGYLINVIVSPADCAICHPVEAEQYSDNIMSQAHSNLVDNRLYRDFMAVVNNRYTYHQDDGIDIGKSDRLSEYESCLYCHGTKVQVSGTTSRDTQYGELEFPVLEGWPNQGVGRINPDNSKGSCTSCHPRHAFSIETARKPHTCSECHKGPDVPAYKVYEVSKHGNIFNASSNRFDFSQVPWQVGRDFTSPTCASCHASLLVSNDQTVIAERTHQYNDRLSWRLFGVPYAHPHPLEADLSEATNSDDLPLAVELDGTPVARYLIDEEEQHTRSSRMKAVCASCHSTSWVDGHFERLENTIMQTNQQTYEATKILMDVWAGDYEHGLPHGANMFDEEAERMWTSIWLFYANSTRFASAMAGGGDYGVFAKGRYQTTEQLTQLFERLQLYRALDNVPAGQPSK